MRALEREVDYIENFNGLLRRLVSNLAARHANDALICRVQKRILLAIDVSPVAAIEAIGPYLYEYRNELYAGNDVFFMQNSYEKDLDGVDDEYASLADQIIPKLKAAWRDSGPGDRGAYLEAVQTLLDCYVGLLVLRLG